MNNLRKFKVCIEGVTPYIMHNSQGASPFSPYKEEKKTLTVKGSKKTLEIEKQLQLLSFMESLYFDKEMGLYIPSEALQKMLLEAARKCEKRTEARSLYIGVEVMDALGFPLQTENSKDLKKIEEDPRNKYFSMVVIQKSRVPNTRAYFKEWSSEILIEIDCDLLNPSQVEKWFEVAGRSVGIGCRRPSAPTPGLFGRFVVTEFKEIK